MRSLPSLADTKTEVEAVAKSVGTDPGDLYLADRATERAVKSAPLQDFQIIYFATHALLPDENSLGQPAIVLTPPEAATAEDDGLLTADEIGTLRLNADWVVLSACNTAGPVGRGLSGLARAFLFAGAKALLVSNWNVASDEAARLMASTFDTFARDPSIGRAEALRRAMIEALDQAPTTERTHPLFWAPFVVVGDGGPSR